ncbi:MAG: hypothetical protein ACKO96_06830 [Flammeovirgaceae bacterium]
MTLKPQERVSINSIQDSDIKYYVLYCLAIVFALILASFLIYLSAHTSIASLRYLNSRLKEIYLHSIKPENMGKPIEDLRVADN